MDDLRFSGITKRSNTSQARFKRLSYPLSLNLRDRKWGSDSDLDQTHLPPIAGDKNVANAKKEIVRPPTPNPTGVRRFENWIQSVANARTSNSLPLSNKKMSLSLDLSPLSEKKQSSENLGFKCSMSQCSDHDSVFCNPPNLDSPKMCVRSLPSSPLTVKRHLHPRRSVQFHIGRTKSSGDEERGSNMLPFTTPEDFCERNNSFKEDMILRWIQDVEDKSPDTTSWCESSLSEFDTSCQTLPAIDENLQSS